MDFKERSEYCSRWMANAINAKKAAEEAQGVALDAASEFGYEMGVMFEKGRIYEELESIFQSLTDEEEDAKLTIEIVKQAILRMDTENDE
jgi:formylmethanofuran dehydrogenase subunit B